MGEVCKMYNKSVTILVNSCDLYEDAWEPFFKLLKIHWPECEQFDIVLNTESKHYDCDFLNVRVYRGGQSVPWSKRLKSCLKTIDSEFIVFFLEDFFIKSRVNTLVFEESLSLLKNEKSIGVVSLIPGLNINNPYWKTQGQYNKYFTEIVDSPARINAVSAIWRKDYLIRLLKDNENPWEFEKNATIRAKVYRKKVYCPVFDMQSPVFDFGVKIEYGYGISSKKWLPKNKELFEKYGIDVNYDNLGWYEADDKPSAPVSKRKKRTKKEILKLIYKNPFELLNMIKVKLKQTLKKIIYYIKVFI